MEFFRIQARGLMTLMGATYGLSEAETAQLEIYMNNGESYQAQQLRIKQLGLELFTDAIWSFEIFLVVCILLKHLADYFWSTRESTTASTKYLA
mmetsp:Transcript_36884/g.48469  ORF Transcript_36884/g.48469 Transcript_36884/m.48469 type:complete len:94 (+) Transcript_36884:119-400(+)